MLDLSKNRIRVIGHYVLLARDAHPESDGSIVIPEDCRLGACFGMVIEIGEKVESVKPKDRIMFHKNYTYLPFEQRRIAVTPDNTIIGIIKVMDKKEMLAPLGTYMVIQPEEGKKVVGGIELPNDNEQAFGGLVMDVGPECVEIEAGARVFYNHGLAISCALGNSKLHIITEEHILCQMKN